MLGSGHFPKEESFGRLDILVSNARPDIEHFYQPVMDIPLENWQIAFDSQARALLVAAREAVKLMPDGGRIIAITYAPGERTGTWQPWVAMGSAKAALESLCRYFAVALATRRITVNAVNPSATEDSVFCTLPTEALQMLRKWAESGWVPMRWLTTPADVGNVVALLCSEEAGFVTGQILADENRTSEPPYSTPPIATPPLCKPGLAKVAAFDYCYRDV